MRDEVTLLDEDFPARLCASFPDLQLARETADRLATLGGSEQLQVEIISPQDHEDGMHPARHTGSASHVSRRSYSGRSYVKGAALGCIGGICLAFGYLATERSAGNSAGLLLLSLALFGALAGLLMATLLSWRSARGIPSPAHAEEGLQGGDWRVIVTAHDLAQHYEARSILASMGGRDIRPV